MKRFLMGLLCTFFYGHGSRLDTEKVYKLTIEYCSFRGARYIGSRKLDLSNMNLSTLEGISDLLVEYNNETVPITCVKRLNVIASSNCLKTIPKEILKLNLVALDVENNEDMVIPDWMFKSLRFYVYFTGNQSFLDVKEKE